MDSLLAGIVWSNKSSLVSIWSEGNIVRVRDSTGFTVEDPSVCKGITIRVSCTSSIQAYSLAFVKN